MKNHNDIYSILNKLQSVQPAEQPAKQESILKTLSESAPVDVAQQLNEKYMGWKKTVSAIKKGGSAEDPEAVAAAIGRKKYGKEKFQKAAAAGKKLGEAAKPDYIDLDKDGNKTEPMKKAAKDAKKKIKESEVEEDMLAKKDYDGDGKVETGKDEYMGSRDKAIKKAMGKDGKEKKIVDSMAENFEDQDSVENRGEYDHEGDMAKDDLSTIEDAANELDSILQADDNLPEWVQSKINKAMDYLDTARDYMKANAHDDNPATNEGEYKDSPDKSQVPAFQRKAKGGDWKVSTKDLDDEQSRSPTSSAGLAKAKERLGLEEGMTKQAMEADAEKMSLEQFCNKYGDEDWVKEFWHTATGTEETYEGWDDMMKSVNEPKGTGKFDVKQTSTGTQYTRKPETYSDDDSDKSTGDSDAPKKRGRPKKNTGTERVTSKAWKHKGGRMGESVKLDTFVEDTMTELDSLLLTEKAVSKQQQKFFGMVHAMQKGEKVPGASAELKKTAKSMSKSDVKDFAKTKHKGLPKKVSEGINFAEMIRETDQTVEEMLYELNAELAEYKRTGHMGDKLRDALEMHRHTKKKIMDTIQVAPEEVVADGELDEFARLAGLKSHTNEAACNMTAEGEHCPVHGMEECWSGGGMMESHDHTLEEAKCPECGMDPCKCDHEEEEVAECYDGSMSPMGSAPAQESGMNISTSVDTHTGRKTLNITADGEAAEELAHLLKLAGLGGGAPEAHVHDAEMTEEFADEPDEQYVGTDAIVHQGEDLNKPKRQYASKPKLGDNPMTLEGRLQELLDSVKVKTK